jgi:hypothetical protein
MQLGMIGLGRMGANMVRRLLKSGHHCVVFDRSAQAVAELVNEKAIGAGSLAEFAKQLSGRQARRSGGCARPDRAIAGSHGVAADDEAARTGSARRLLWNIPNMSILI